MREHAQRGKENLMRRPEINITLEERGGRVVLGGAGDRCCIDVLTQIGAVSTALEAEQPS